MENHAANAVADLEDDLPLQFYLSQNYPNPFNGETTIKYCVAYKTRVVLSVFDAEGKEVERLADEEQNPGTYEVGFCVKGTAINEGSSGAFSYRLTAGDFTAAKSMYCVR